ncbi:MAG: hypothetical protein KME45_21595 [Stenomitos rutilans HA7619-LM2]|jgi:hypothetical protein|nr:hypothetical protein [Stenomitos rutilans HA7619-LM2]
MAIDLSPMIQSAKTAVYSFIANATNSANAEAKSALSNARTLAEEPKHSIETLTSHLSQSISNLNAFIGNLKTSVLETTSGAISNNIGTIPESTNQATNTIVENTGRASGAFDAATSIAVQVLNDAATSLTQTAGKTKNSLNETWQKTGQVSEMLSSSIQNLVVTSNQLWLEEHPMVSWLVAHPFWAIALVLLTLFLTWSLLGAIAQFTQQAFLLILQAPLRLIQSLFRGVFQLLKRTDNLPLTQFNEEQMPQKRLVEILNRLESLRQEQEALMKEMQTILLSKH